MAEGLLGIALGHEEPGERLVKLGSEKPPRLNPTTWLSLATPRDEWKR